MHIYICYVYVYIVRLHLGLLLLCYHCTGQPHHGMPAMHIHGGGEDKSMDESMDSAGTPLHKHPPSLGKQQIGQVCFPHLYVATKSAKCKHLQRLQQLHHAACKACVNLHAAAQAFLNTAAMPWRLLPLCQQMQQACMHPAAFILAGSLYSFDCAEVWHRGRIG